MKKLKIAVLAFEPTVTITEHLAAEAHAREYVYDVIKIPRIVVDAITRDPAITQLLAYDVVYYRTGLEGAGVFYLEQLLKQHGIPFINGIYRSHPYIRSKVYQLLTVADAGIRTAHTLSDVTGNFTEIAQLLGTPVVAKADISSQGRDVVLVSSQKDVDVLLEDGTKTWLFQSFIPHEYDIRVRVIGGKAVSAHSRYSKEGEFRTNCANGGKVVSIPEGDTKEQVYKLAEQVIEVLPLHIAAVDFIVGSEDGTPYFTEINANVGWSNDENKVTGADMSGLVVDYFESVVSK